MKPIIKINSILFTIFLPALVLLPGCQKFVQVPVPPNLITSGQIMSDSAGTNSAVLGLYTSMMGGGSSLSTFNGNITLFTGLTSDELTPTTGTGDEKAAYTNSLRSNSSVVANIWLESYS